MSSFSVTSRAKSFNIVTSLSRWSVDCLCMELNYWAGTVCKRVLPSRRHFQFQCLSSGCWAFKWTCDIFSPQLPPFPTPTATNISRYRTSKKYLAVLLQDCEGLPWWTEKRNNFSSNEDSTTFPWHETYEYLGYLVEPWVSDCANTHRSSCIRCPSERKLLLGPALILTLGFEIARITQWGDCAKFSNIPQVAQSYYSKVFLKNSCQKLLPIPRLTEPNSAWVKRAMIARRCSGCKRPRSKGSLGKSYLDILLAHCTPCALYDLYDQWCLCSQNWDFWSGRSWCNVCCPSELSYRCRTLRRGHLGSRSIYDGIASNQGEVALVDMRGHRKDNVSQLYVRMHLFIYNNYLYKRHPSPHWRDSEQTLYEFTTMKHTVIKAPCLWAQ